MSSTDGGDDGSMRSRAQRVAAQMKPVAAKIKPLAQSTGEAARAQTRKTRAWAAPHVERTGKALEENVAPKVSKVLSSAAERIDPANDAKRPKGQGLFARLMAMFRGKPTQQPPA